MGTPESETEVQSDSPGLGRLREAVENSNVRGGLATVASLRRDTVAGLNSAVSSVPDGMACGILAGVNPVYGLYAAMAGPIAGGLFSSSRLMVVTTTSASALAAGQAVVNVPAEERPGAVFTMVVLAGLIQIFLGLIKFGRFTRFVSYSVMTGFVAGIAVLTVLTQLPTATAYEPTGGNRITQTLDLLAHVQEFHWLSLGPAALALVLAVVLPRTPLGNLGMVFAILIPSVLVVRLDWDSVQFVSEVGTFTGGMPEVFVPGPSDFRIEVLTGAFALALIVLVQGAGVSQSVPNPDGSRSSISRDFVGQGAANVASGLIHGIPVGGSLGSTALNVLSGARTRWAAVLSGCWVGIIVILFPDLIGRVAMPTLAALLIVASASAIPLSEARSLWQTGRGPRAAMVVTFVATLFFRIEVAVATGVVLSIVIHLLRSASDISIVELRERGDGRIVESKVRKRLDPDSVTILDIYGSVFFAAARALEKRLPEPPKDGGNFAVVIRFRGRVNFGATLIEVLSAYGRRIREAGGRLYLSGVTEEVINEVNGSGKLQRSDEVHVFAATPVLGQATRDAAADARHWMEAEDAARRASEKGSG